jgi:hypothetical protein
MAKKSRAKYNNKYKIPNDKVLELRQLSNPELVGRCTLEYCNWVNTIKMKKDDAAIQNAKSAIKDIKESIKENPEFQELEAEFIKKKEELITEELAKYQEELKNLLQPYNEDVAHFRGMFKVAIEELDERKKKGLV